MTVLPCVVHSWCFARLTYIAPPSPAIDAVEGPLATTADDDAPVQLVLPNSFTTA